MVSESGPYVRSCDQKSIKEITLIHGGPKWAPQSWTAVLGNIFLVDSPKIDLPLYNKPITTSHVQGCAKSISIPSLVSLPYISLFPSLHSSLSLSLSLSLSHSFIDANCGMNQMIYPSPLSMISSLTYFAILSAD